MKIKKRVKTTHTHTARRLLTFGVLFTVLAVLTFTACQKDYLEDNESSTTSRFSSTSEVMKISFDVLSTTTFDVDKRTLNPLDLANVNPHNEKQHIDMLLHNDGIVDMTILELDFKNKFILPSFIPKGDFPETKKTILSGNQLSIYDKNNKLITSTTINAINRMDIVKKIKAIGNSFTQEDINSTLASLRGIAFVDNLTKFIDNASANGVEIVSQSNEIVTIRTSESSLGLQGDNTIVLLISKLENKLLATRVYDKNNKLISTTYLSYNDGDKAYIKATRTIQPFLLPSSGREINMIVTSQIDNFNFKLNTK